MTTNDEEIDAILSDLDIVEAIEDKDVPYVVTQIRGLIKEIEIKARADSYRKGQEDLVKCIFEADGVDYRDLIKVIE